jgi:hypothetical protein
MKYVAPAYLTILLFGCGPDACPPTGGIRTPASNATSDSDPRVESVPSPSATKLAADPCDGIREARFESVKDLGNGLGPDGTVSMGKLSVEFRGGVVRFEVADTLRSGTYVCEDGDISSTGDESFRGHFDVVKGTLTWNGQEYERVE